MAVAFHNILTLLFNRNVFTSTYEIHFTIYTGLFFFKYNTYYRKSFKANYLQNDYNNLKMDDTIKHGSQPPIYGNVFWQ